MSLAGVCKCALLMLVVLGMSGCNAVGTASPSGTSTTAGAAPVSSPPVGISGFEYKYIPDGRIHMNLCKTPACVPGSKVSYTFFGPVANPDIEEYTNAQNSTVSALRARAPEGATIRLEKVEQSRDLGVTVFTSSREIRSPDGLMEFTKSTLVFYNDRTISLISSSEEKEAAESNGALFLMGLMVRSETSRNSGM